MEYRITDSLESVSKADLVFSLWSCFDSMFRRVEKRVRSPQALDELREYSDFLMRLYRQLGNQ